MRAHPAHLWARRSCRSATPEPSRECQPSVRNPTDCQGYNFELSGGPAEDDLELLRSRSTLTMMGTTRHAALEPVTQRLITIGNRHAMPNPPAVQLNSMKRKMDAGELAVGMLVRIMRGVEVAAIARSAGFDCLYIDLEHCSFSLETVSQISIAAAALGVTPLVRVPGKDKGFIGRTLEAGAQGIIVPHVENRAEAEMVVEAARFPPAGDRSLLAINPHTLFRGGPAAETMRMMDEATMVAGMIESVQAVGNADDIASVAGLDMLLVGANDLCNSLGVPGQLDHPSLRMPTAMLPTFATRGASTSAWATQLATGHRQGDDRHGRALRLHGQRYRVPDVRRDRGGQDVPMSGPDPFEGSGLEPAGPSPSPVSTWRWGTGVMCATV